MRYIKLNLHVCKIGEHCASFGKHFFPTLEVKGEKSAFRSLGKGPLIPLIKLHSVDLLELFNSALL